MAEEDLTKPWHERAREELENLKKELVGDEGQGGERKAIEDRIKNESITEMSAYTLNQGLHRIVIVSYGIAQVVLASLSTYMMLYIGAVAGVNTGLLILLLQVAHIAASLKSVQVDDLAGTTFFGRPTSAPEPGLIFVPWLLMQLHTVSRNYKDHRFPGQPDKILRLSTEVQVGRDHGDAPDPTQAAAGFVRPLIVVSGQPRLNDEEKEERQKELNVDPFDERNSFEISYVVRYRPNQEFGGIFRLVRNVGLPKNGVSLEDMIVDLLRENSERDIKAMIARQTLATTIENQSLMNEVFAYRLQVSVMRLGIDIDTRGTGLDDINPSHKTNEAQADARRARFARQQTIIAADAEKEKKIREGQGVAEAELLLLEARGKGFKKIKDDTGVSGDVVIASETARNFKDANTIFGAQGIKEILAMPGLFTPKEKKEGE